MKHYERPEDLTRPDGLLPQLTAALVSRAMNAEMAHHLGYEPGPPTSQSNRRNGTTGKNVRTGHGTLNVMALPENLDRFVKLCSRRVGVGSVDTPSATDSQGPSACAPGCRN